MGSFSNYLENAILNHVFSKGAYTPPTIWVALSTADPGEDGSGLAEPSGNNYSRKQTSAADWTTAASGSLSNANALEFAQASGSWSTISHFALFDADESGNMLAHGALEESKPVGTNDIFRFAAGDLDVTLD